MINVQCMRLKINILKLKIKQTRIKIAFSKQKQKLFGFRQINTTLYTNVFFSKKNQILISKQYMCIYFYQIIKKKTPLKFFLNYDVNYKIDLYIILQIKLMIAIGDILEAAFCSLIFTLSTILASTYIETKYSNNKNTNEAFVSKARLKIAIMTVIMFVLVTYTHTTHCYNKIGLLQCLYIQPGEDFVRNMAKALFINTTLFLGGLHQELYNGGIKKKFQRFYKRQFQWGLFKKLFIVPLYAQIVYRAIFCRIVDPDLHHPSFFTFLSGLFYAFSHLINLFRFEAKFGKPFSRKIVAIQIGYSLIFGLYVSHIFTKSRTLISSLVLQVYANFMGYPQYFQILKGNNSDDRVRKSTIFYLCGVLGCLSCCLFL